MYSELVLDHFNHPRNQGSLENATCQAHRENPVCGDEVTLSARVTPSGRLETLRFQAVGCPPAIAATSLLTEWAQGRTIQEAQRLTPQELSEMLGGLPPNKSHAVILAVETLRAICSSHGLSV
jgi:NifU-like protein involved in Fe-S cluster formation